MPRVHHVKSARKPIRDAGIKIGDEYYWWKFRRGGKRVSKTPPKRQQLTQSDFQISVYDLEDRLSDLKPESFDDVESLQSELDDIASEITALGEEQNDKLSNMPESLQQGPTGELLQERADACETWAGEIESIKDNIEDVDRDEIAAEVRREREDEDPAKKTDEEDGEAIEDAIENRYREKLAEVLQTAISDAQGTSI